MSTTAVSYTTVNGVIISEVRNGVRHDYMRDPLGSTVGLIDSTTSISDTFAYWPYGEVRSQTGTTGTLFKFVGTLGYFLDAATSFCYVRARHLVTALARWLTVDPLWPMENAFPYADLCPAFKTDASGKMADCQRKFAQCVGDRVETGWLALFLASVGWIVLALLVCGLAVLSSGPMAPAVFLACLAMVALYLGETIIAIVLGVGVGSVLAIGLVCVPPYLACIHGGGR